MDKVSYKLLRRLYKCRVLDKADAYKILAATDNGQPEEHISFLKRENLIRERVVNALKDGEGGHIGGEYSFEITLAGISYVEQRHRDAFTFWLPTLIALAALIFNA